MHLVRFTPAVLLALASVGSARPAANVSVNAYDAILEASPATLARDIEGNNIFLTKDNSCGKIGAGKNLGWYCDPMKAKGGACCSSDGWCGNGPKYCEAGCQKGFGHCDKGLSKPPKHVIKCGPKNKNKKCNNDECCSINGFCGTNKNFCGVGCQDKFGKCEAKRQPKPVDRKPKPAPKPIERRCGPANKNQKCPGLDCCSHAGYCGIGTEYCAVPQNCQRGFGRCDSDMFPVGASTLKDPRPQLGKIEYGKYIMDCKVPGTVAMTFDDGPNVYTAELLDKLKVAGAKATFMIGGNNNGRQVDQGDVWPKLLRRMITEGHQVASHTWSHPHMNAIKSEDRKLEMAKTERAIANIIGKYPTYMRPPYSECDEKSGCQKDMKDMGYSIIGVPFDTLDWKNAAGHIQESDKLVEEFFDKLGPESHPLICQHDILSASVQELTPIVLEQIKEKGMRAVTIGECLGDDIANWYRTPGKGTRWTDAKATQTHVTADKSESEHPEPEHQEESHEEEKRDPGFIFGPHAEASPMPTHTTAPINIEADYKQAKRQIFFHIPPVEARNHGIIETDHEIEDVEMEIARTKLKVPTLPSAFDIHTLRVRDDPSMPSQAEVDHTYDEMVTRFLSPEQLANDKNVEMTPEDVKDAEAAQEKCVFEDGFCGKIQHFITKTGCFQSAKHCFEQSINCFNDKYEKEADGKGVASEPCQKFKQICEEQGIFCLHCAGKGQPECKSTQFKPWDLE